VAIALAVPRSGEMVLRRQIRRLTGWPAAGSGDTVTAFSISNRVLADAPTSHIAASFGFPGLTIDFRQLALDKRKHHAFGTIGIR
jgi:hypothetical protein